MTKRVEQAHHYPTEWVGGEEQRELATRAQGGDRAAFEKLLRGEMAYIQFIARRAHRWARSRSTSTEMDDLIQAGAMGVQRAVRGWEPTRDSTFHAYASYWIDNYIHRTAGEEMRLMSGATKATGYEGNKLRAELERHRRVGMTYDEAVREAAKAVGIDLQTAYGWIAATQRSISIDREDLDGQTLHDFLPHRDPGPEELLDKAETEHRVREVVASLNFTPRELQVLHRRLMTDSADTLDAVAQDWACSRETIRNIEKSVLKRLREAFVGAPRDVPPRGRMRRRGPKPRTVEGLARVAELRAAGLSERAIARVTGIGKNTIRAYAPLRPTGAS